MPTKNLSSSERTKYLKSKTKFSGTVNLAETVASQNGQFPPTNADGVKTYKGPYTFSGNANDKSSSYKLNQSQTYEDLLDLTKGLYLVTPPPLTYTAINTTRVNNIGESFYGNFFNKNYTGTGFVTTDIPYTITDGNELHQEVDGSLNRLIYSDPTYSLFYDISNNCYNIQYLFNHIELNNTDPVAVYQQKRIANMDVLNGMVYPQQMCLTQDPDLCINTANSVQPDVIDSPLNFRASLNSTTNVVTLTWETPPENLAFPLIGYILSYVPNNGVPVSPIGTSTLGPLATSYNITLQNYYLYTFYIVSVNIEGTSFPAMTSVTTKPNTPRNFAVSMSNTGTASLSWDAPSGTATVSSYTVRYTPSGGATTTITGITSLLYTITGLPAGNLFDFSVVAVNSAGESPIPATASASTVPNPPVWVSASINSGGTASLSWNAPAGTAALTNYTLNYSSSGGSSGTTTIAGGSTSTTVSSLSAGYVYTFSLIANNSTGSSSAAVTTANSKPLTPQNFTASISGTTASLAWGVPIGDTPIVSYTVTYTPSGGGTTTITGIVGTSTTILGLSVGNLYDFTVIAVNAVGSSATPATASASTTPNQPSWTSAVISTAGTATLNWAAPSGTAAVSSYTVTYSSSGGSSGTTSPISGLSTTIAGLAIGYIYTFGLVATNSAGSSSPEVTTTATTQPAAPTWVSASIGVTGVANLVWSPSGTATVTNYDVSYSYSGGLGNSKTVGVTGTTFTDLSAGYVYTFGVRANNAIGPSALSQTTANSLPLVPRNLVVTDSANSLIVTWSAPLGDTAISSYTITYSPGGGSPATPITGIVGLTQTITGLTSGTTYTVNVAAVNSVGTGPNVTGTGTPFDLVPEVIILNNPRVFPRSGGTSGEVGFMFCIPSGTWPDGYSNFTQVTVTNLTSGGNVTIAGADYSNSIGSKYWVYGEPATNVGLFFTTLAAQVGQVGFENLAGCNPSNSVASGMSFGQQLQFYFDGGSGGAPSNYTITTDYGSGVIDITQGLAYDNYHTITTSTIAGVSSNGEFTVGWKGYGGSGNDSSIYQAWTSPSYTGSVPNQVFTSPTTTPYTYYQGIAKMISPGNTQIITPGVPTSLSITSGSNALNVSWSAPTSGTVASYTLTYTPSGGSTSTVTGIGGTSYTITGLGAGVTYTIEVWGVNSGGAGGSVSGTGTPGGCTIM